MKNTTQAKAPNQDGEDGMDMDNSALQELFLSELKDIYWAEKHLISNLPKVAKKATSDELKDAIEGHLKETENQATRLEQVFESLGRKTATRRCEAMAGLIAETDAIVAETSNGTTVRDVAIISCLQKIEHYEIATYGTLRTLAGVMDYRKAEDLLAATLNEEKEADKKLTEIAQSFVNENARAEHR